MKDYEIIPAHVSWLYVYNRLNESDKKKFLELIKKEKNELKKKELK